MAGTVATVLALIATVVVNVGAVPQLATVVRRRGDCPGVSLTAAAMIAASCAGWLAYSLTAALAVSAVSSALGLLAWGTITALVARHRHPTALAAPAVFATALTAAALVDPAALAALLVADAVLTTVPQLVRARRDAAGVSRTTWASIAAAATCWVAYGLANADVALVASQSVRALAAGFVVVTITAGRPATAITTSTFVPTGTATSTSTSPAAPATT